MSGKAGPLNVDARHLYDDPGSDDDPSDLEVEEPDRIGAWPEEMDDVRFYADSSLTIPGQSEPPGECGEWGPREFCKSCGKVHIGPHKCQRRVCEDCWLTWRGNRAAAMTERLAGARRDAEGADKRLSHCLVSPPMEEIQTLVEFEQAKQRAYELAKEKGIDGGVLIPHAWRVTKEAKETFSELKEAGLVDGGIWQWVREHERDWRALTRWGPHFHILGMGADLDESDPAGDDGWTWWRIDSFERFDLTDAETYRPMFKASSYLLSHVAFEPEEGKQAIRWFGSLANNQFSLDADLEDWEQSVIERNVAEIAGHREESGDGPASDRECEAEDCEGALESIYEAGRYLSDPTWCQKIGRDRERELAAGFEWAIRERRPPPGMRHPQTEEQGEEAFETLI